MSENELRQALNDLADEGRAVDLGRAALAGAQRRRRARLRNTTTTVAAAVAAAAVIIPTQLLPEGDDGAPAGDPGRFAVTSYYPAEPGQPPMLLDPRTGEYFPADAVLPGANFAEPPAVSPDLRQVAANARRYATLLVAETGPGNAEASPIPMPAHGFDHASWSPDSERIALWAPLPGADPDVLGAVVVAEPATGRAYEVPIQLPPGRTALAPAAGELAWLDADHLVVPTTDRGDEVVPAPRQGEPGRPVVTSLSVVDLTGTVVDEILVQQDPRPLHAGWIWQPYGPVRDGRALLVRTLQPARLDLAVVDLDAATAPYDAVPATVPPAPLPDGISQPAIEVAFPAGAVWHDGQKPGWLQPTAWPTAWLGDGYALVESGEYRWRDGFEVPARHYLVDLRSGQARPVELPVLGNRTAATFAGTDLLSPEAARRAATFSPQAR